MCVCVCSVLPRVRVCVIVTGPQQCKNELFILDRSGHTINIIFVLFCFCPDKTLLLSTLFILLFCHLFPLMPTIHNHLMFNDIFVCFCSYKMYTLLLNTFFNSYV